MYRIACDVILFLNFLTLIVIVIVIVWLLRNGGESRLCLLLENSFLVFSKENMFIKYKIFKIENKGHVWLKLKIFKGMTVKH
jgi:hypothetical protein